MTLTRFVALACLAIACGTSDKPADPPPVTPAARPVDAAPAIDPACAAKVKELESVLAAVPEGAPPPAITLAVK